MKKALLQLHTAIFLAGFTGILGRLITLNEGLLVWWRMFITVATILFLSIFTKEIRRIDFRTLLKIIGVGAIVALHWVCFYGSIKYANVSISLVCFSTIGFFTAFFEPVILRRRIDWMEVLFGLIAILGVYLIFHFDPQYKTGIILGILSSLLASLFPIFNKVILTQTDGRTLTFFELAGGLLILSFIMPFYLKVFPSDHIIPGMADFGWLLILSWLCTVLAFNLSVSSLKKISPFTVSLSYNLEPIYGIILAFVIYHENRYLSGGFYYGFALIMITVVLQTWRLYYTHRKMSLTPKLQNNSKTVDI
ncbi:MAG: EamA family transporter [Bacteroidetes bacterium]|nr:MAG: EamA family transporter [Bacteroidota bacterium]